MWRTELTRVENLGDDLWGGVKVSSNSEIAGSLRNSFRASLGPLRSGGRDTESDRGPSRATLLNQTPNTIATIPGVSRRGISSVDERETTQITR